MSKKYLVITRSLQSDFEWEHDAEHIATICLDLLKIQFPKKGLQYRKAFITYLARYIADSSIRPGESQQKIRQRLKDLIEEIELVGFEETQKAYDDVEQAFKFNYEDKDYDMLAHLLETSIEQYYLNVKPEIIDEVEFLKQDYGEDNLYFVNSSIYYSHLMNSFYKHHCKVLYSPFNEKDELLEELAENKTISGDFELISA
jgi:hypothetical protein